MTAAPGLTMSPSSVLPALSCATVTVAALVAAVCVNKLELSSLFLAVRRGAAWDLELQVSEEKFNNSNQSQVINLVGSLSHSDNYIPVKVHHSVVEMYHSKICTSLSKLQSIPLSKLINDQILNFSLNPWDHLSPSEGWECSESEEENNSVITDKFSVQSAVSPRSHYTTVLPDVSHFTLEDCETKSEDSEYSSFDENDLATKVRIL